MRLNLYPKMLHIWDLVATRLYDIHVLMEFITNRFRLDVVGVTFGPKFPTVSFSSVVDSENVQWSKSFTQWTRNAFQKVISFSFTNLHVFSYVVAALFT